MQTSAPEAFDLSWETSASLTLYGTDEPATSEFGTQCLIARRLVEKGVRCIQLRDGGWDAHGSLESNCCKHSRAVDRPIAGLLTDLKQCGLLEDTLVVWGGEFGRTPTTEGSAKGEKTCPRSFAGRIHRVDGGRRGERRANYWQNRRTWICAGGPPDLTG